MQNIPSKGRGTEGEGRGILWRDKCGSPFQIQIIFLFYAYDNSFWPTHCILINIHVIPDCRWKYGGGIKHEKEEGVIWRTGATAGNFLSLFPYSKHPLRPCADREMFIPCCSCKNYCKDRDSKIRLWHYVADVVLKGGKIPSVKRKATFSYPSCSCIRE